MDSLILIGFDSEVFYERHWNNTEVSLDLKPIIDFIISGSPPPSILAANDVTFITLSVNDIYFISVVSKEVSPFFILETLNQIREVLESYFAHITHNILKEKIMFVYIIIDEMFINGFPLLNWPSLVQQVIKPKNFLDRLTKSLGVDKNEHGTSELSEPIVWRDSSITFDNNDILLDFYETLNMIIDKQSNIISGEINGMLISNIIYSGVPKMVCTFSKDVSLLSNFSFHPCVNSARFNADRVLEFVPPNGRTELMVYTSDVNDNRLPFIFQYELLREKEFILKLKLSTKEGIKNQVEDLSIFVNLPEDTKECAVFTGQNEKYFYSSHERFLTWNAGSLPNSSTKWLDAKIDIDPACFDISSIIVELSFMMKHISLSQAKIINMDVTPKTEKEYRGVKYTSKSGRIEIRL